MFYLQKSLPGTLFPRAPLLQLNIYKMNKQVSLLAITAFITLFAASLVAQQNIVKITPLPLLGKFGLQYERKLVGRYSIEVDWQHWDVRHKEVHNIFLPGIVYVSSSPASSGVRIKGNRFQVAGRRYKLENMSGWFVEGGFNVGKFDVSDTYKSGNSLFGPLWGSPGYNWGRTTRWDNIWTRGVKLGGGFQKKRRSLFATLSGGIELNVADKKAAAFLSRLYQLAPYGRFVIGIGF